MRAALLLPVIALLIPAEAEAQYKNAQLGFEGGYGFYAGDLRLDHHGFMVGLRGSFKAEDHWWFSAKALLSLRGEQQISERTAVILNLSPVAVRYYILTDSFRPFIGITNAFQFVFNSFEGTKIFWGPGVEAGLEFKIVRDIFIGLQVDGLYMFAFQHPDDPMFTATVQLNFFL